MFCSCGRRRRVVAPALPEAVPLIPQITSFTREPMMLSIRVPKRTRWAPYDDEHKMLFKEKTNKSLAHINLLPPGEKRFRAAIILFNDMIAQPVYLASIPLFREVSRKKVEEELEAYAKAYPESRYDDEFRETSYQWHELMTELHDHPLYKED